MAGLSDHIDVPIVVTTEHTARRGRPAETTALAGGGLTAVLVANGASAGLAAALALASGVAAHVVTWVLNAGGIRPAVRSLIGK